MRISSAAGLVVLLLFGGMPTAQAEEPSRRTTQILDILIDSLRQAQDRATGDTYHESAPNEPTPAVDGSSLTERAAQRRRERLQNADTGTTSTRTPAPDYTASDLEQSVLERRQARLAESTEPALSQTEMDRLRAMAIAERRERRLEQEERLELLAQLGDVTDLRQEIINLVNQERRQAGLSPLTRNVLLERSAQLHAEDMLRNAYFSHFSLNGDSHVARIKAQGYGDLHAADCDCNGFRVVYGENLAKGQRTPEQVVEDWMNSPTHRENILSTQYDEIGIGVAGVYWVQHFGSIEFQ